MFLLCLIFVASFLLYFWHYQKYTYWSVRQVKHDLPLPLFGNHLKNVLGLRTDTEMTMEMYKKYSNERFVGYYRGKTPVLIVRDPGLIKLILNDDFLYFYGRGLVEDQEELLMLNVFNAQGDRWRLLRHALSSAFTTAKLRSMFPLIKKCTQRLENVARNLATLSDGINAYDLMTRYTTEFIGACGFGIDMQTLNTEKSLFLKLGKMIFTKSKWQIFFLSLREIFPTTWLKRKISASQAKIRIMIMDIMNIIRKDRILNTIERNDFVDLLLQLEKTKKIQGQSMENQDEQGEPIKAELTFSEMYTAAQLFVFFAAGFETSATTISWTLHQLAYNLDVQRKVQDEIDRIYKKYTEICYDAISEMNFSKMTIKESNRTFSPAGYITRECMKRYVIPGTKVVIDPGVIVFIPVQAIHLDAKYYEYPLEFRPERFSPEEERKRHKYAFLPFGEGPRKCIGSRLGHLQSMSALVSLLRYFNIEPVPTFRRQYKVKRCSFLVQAIKGGMPILLKPRKDLCVP